MKVYIQTDLEGCAGFCFYQDFEDRSMENVQHCRRMCQLLTDEVNAAVRGACEAGADEILVNDNHGSGYNILFEQLDPRCRIIHGRNCSGPHWLPLFDDSFDALVLIGMHAMGETENAVAPHSKWEVNGGEIYLSEASMAAAVAGDYGVPTVFLSGDDKLTDEVRAKIPGVEFAVVKESIGSYMAVSLIPSEAHKRIQEGVRKGLGQIGSMPPYIVEGPVTLQLLDSPGHLPPLPPVLPEPVKDSIINAALVTALNRMPWNKFNTKLPDGFQYPSGKISVPKPAS